MTHYFMNLDISWVTIPPPPISLLTAPGQLLDIRPDAQIVMAPLSALIKNLGYHLINSSISKLLKKHGISEEKSCLQYS